MRKTGLRREKIAYMSKKNILIYNSEYVVEFFFEEQKGGKWEKREQSSTIFDSFFFLRCINMKMSMRRRRKKCKNILKFKERLKDFWDMVMHLTSKKKSSWTWKHKITHEYNFLSRTLRWKIRRRNWKCVLMLQCFSSIFPRRPLALSRLIFSQISLKKY